MNQFQYQALFIGIILLLIIFFSLVNVDPVPYTNENVFSHVYPYTEGLDGHSPETLKTGDKIQTPPPLHDPTPSPTTTPKSTTTYKPNSTSSISESNSTNQTSVEGFEGLQTSAYGVERPIDIFSNLKSGTNCEPSSFSNSLGYLCLDKNAKHMLQTRGGNQTGNI